ncbi:myosin-binding protein 3-like isoform X1 [Papaver somniferum]|uniref:myosin-binding protein 3-like isoform X1 n=1 Tax=Papaver somniferum TaxID=3469 RepID=UPI000E6FFB0D|nr:myosin-binding protein 3-like isoform X1 [Papaver somniferum]XP_026449801.1 myosin-binding protein 3-like isoform X1 [Papaver somniferum]XP_026449802.1 myosin-binding protein 3-like isoform X1 [Papaver somniferum]
MDTKTAPSVKLQKGSRGFSAGLASAFHEWLLIFLLFVNAVFSYLVTKFARSNKLKTPCLLCSRLDHVIGNESPGFYKDLICGAHKLEISSLVYCHIHDKLADVRDMCEGCLFSFTSEKKSVLETNRFLVGKLGSNLESCFHLDDSPKDPSSKKQCSCCKETWNSRAYDQKFFQKKSAGPEGQGGHSHLNHSDGLETGNKKMSGQLKTSYLRSRSFEALSHIGYSELKLTSESESEIPLSEDDDDDDDDDTSTMAHNVEDPSKEIESNCIQPESATITAQILHNDFAPKKFISSSPAFSVHLPNEKIDVGEPDSLTPLHSTQGGLPTIAVEVPDDKTDAGEHNCLAPMHSDQAGSATLSVEVPKGKLDACEPNYLTPVLSDQTHSSTLSVTVPKEKFDVGEPDYLTPVLSDQPVLHALSVQIPKEKTDAGEPDYLTPVFSEQAGLPLLSVQIPNDQVDVGEPEYLTPLVSVRAGSPELPVLVQDENIDAHESNYLTPLAFSDAIGHGLEELDWHQSEQLDDPAAPAEVVPQKDIPSTQIAKSVAEASGGTLDTSGTGLDQAVTIKTERVAEFENDQISTGGLCSRKDEATDTLHAEETGNSGQSHGTEDDEMPKLEAGHTTPNPVNSTDSLKLVIGNKGNPISTIFAEQLTPKNSTIHEDLKLLLSQAARGVESSSNDMSPRALDRYESGIESLDGSVVSEIDGESVIDRLKRQIEHDRKSMNALYKELEEERNASAVAANQAMAMITRLQEEKASLHMEALQYLRMMEEQAEYDVDALQKANDLLAEREKDIQDLEEELDIYRIKFPDIDAIQDSWHDLGGGDMKIEQSDVNCSNLPNNLLLSEKSKDGNKPGEIDARVGYTSLIKDSLSEFEDEKLYITRCLKKLETRLNLLLSNKVYANKSHSGYLGEECHGVNSSSLQNGHLEENESLGNKGSTYIGEISVEESSNSPAGNDQLLSKENHHSDSYPQKESTADRDADLVSLENEVAELNERLEALEEDRTFVKHTINALRKSGEGMQFVQEIAHHLRELRRIGTKRIEQAVT